MKNFKFVNFMFMIKLYTFLILGIVFYCALNTSSLVVFAENISNFVEIKNNSDILSKETIYKIKSLTKEMFGDVNVSSNEYLYNLDGSSDYIYVEFENSGYAIYYKETMELLEYSAQGYLSYPTDSIKFYGGPSMYLTKQNDLFVDTLTGDILNISSKSANLYSNEVREMLLSNYEHREKTPFNFDYSSICDNSISEDAMSKQLYEDSSLIKQEISGLEDIEEDIPTYNRDALIRVIDGTYIPNYNYFLSEPLHGQNQTGTCGAVAAQLLLSYNNYYNDRRIIEDKYLNGGESEPEKSPNLCSNPMLMNKHTLGTRGYYENGSDDTNSYFSYVVSKIPANAYSYQVTNGLNNILMERNELISGRIDYTLTSSRIFDPSDITSEIDSGRPVIILMQESLGGTDHYVVAYGYRNYLYPNSTTSYLGYITHFGWKSSGAVNYLNIWVNSSWCHTYYSLEINHTHNYTIDTGNNINGQYRELKCGECGHRTVDTLYSVNSTGAITGLKYSNVPNSIVIPTQINNTNVNSIGANAFLNCTNLQSVTFEAGSQLTSIGYNAFASCINLGSIKIPSSVTSIGSQAFIGCSNLEKVVMYNQTTVPTLGTNAFNYTYSGLQIYVPYSLENAYKTATNWSSYANKIEGWYIENNRVYIIESGTVSVADQTELVTLYSYNLSDVWADYEEYLYGEAFIAVGGSRVFYVDCSIDCDYGEMINCSLKIEVEATTSCILINSDKQFVAECFIEDGILTVPYLEIYNSGEGFYLLPIMPNGQAIEFVPSDISLEYTARIYV